MTMPFERRLAFRAAPLLALAAAATLALAAPAPAAGEGAVPPPADAERSAHGDDAATPRLVHEERIGGALLRQYQLGCLSLLSYLVGSEGEAAVIDPQRDVERYIADAKALGLAIKVVVLTHPHADFVAGHTELMRRTGAKAYVSPEARPEFPFEPFGDGARVKVGGVVLEAWATPGHTPNATTVLARVPGAASDPAWAFTGDTLFIGGIGRPDLLDVPAALLASRAFDSMKRLMTLPDATAVLPAHGAGSLCGAHLSPETTSTIGREKATNPYLASMSRAAFVSRLLSEKTVAPQYFRWNVEINRKGPPVLDAPAAPPPVLSPEEAKKAIAAGAWVVDLRDQRAYAAGHVEGSVNVAVRGRLDTWTGIVVPFDAKVILLGSDDEVREGAFRLRRIGYDAPAGYLAGGVEAWRSAGLSVRASRVVPPRDLEARVAAGTEPLIVDVRTPEEHAEVRIGEYGNIPVTEWERLGAALDRDAPVLFYCNSSYRSSIAVGLAERLGFRDVASLDGGLDAWMTERLPTRGPGAPAAGAASAPALPTAAPAQPASSQASSGQPAAAAPRPAPLALPEPIDARTLASVLMDQPAQYAVLDIRPAWQQAEFRLPGAVAVAPEGVAAHVRALPAHVRPVIVDRDGSLAFAVAGAALERLGPGARPVRALVGGLARYYREVEITGAGPSAGSGGAAPAPSAAPLPAAPAPATAPVPAPAPPPEPAAPAARPKRSAGC